ncbi:hypothetical protein TrRE_jg1342 [Triparma retinervis]|uniref:Phytanoyl-CoA dioxygenase n=1 Tax=Triparma retinervis TaxID=2557542 RepID=A0A9W7A097_9STRA|nr:hypothetical protein TrRE_jg1342 [Triparma retinervis]
MVGGFPQPKQALLRKGDCVVFDMRCLHVGQGYKGKGSGGDDGKARALFNLTFRNPEATEDIGYEGSIREEVRGWTLGGMQREIIRGEKEGGAFGHKAVKG